MLNQTFFYGREQSSEGINFGLYVSFLGEYITGAKYSAGGNTLGYPDISLGPPHAAETSKRLDEYFGGLRQDFELPLKPEFKSQKHKAALDAICRIPYGKTAPYGGVAAEAGLIRAARFVGNVCHTNPLHLFIPCDRVVAANGGIGGFIDGGIELKRFLLRLEDSFA